jgi:cyd operon protein YbgT
MWYFSWILGVGVALAFGIINVMWLESRRTGATVSGAPDRQRHD